ncbi:MAG: hypothetical protein ACRDU9_00465 [Acidimicrobiia bacterium]
MRVGVVDIGTNSMRLLITDGQVEVGRWVEVTGLGQGVDDTRVLPPEGVERTLVALTGFGRLMDETAVAERAAIATSATRDAANRDQFLERAGEALGVIPNVVSGEREGRLAYAGATSDLTGGSARIVSDIGGGSTEFVSESGVFSVDIGSVRLTDRVLPNRPPGTDELRAARAHVSGLFARAPLAVGSEVVGVAGTWTSLAAIDLGLPAYRGARVHHHRITRPALAELTANLASMTVARTAEIAALDPARAPVILAGAIVAESVLDTLAAGSVLVSERDSLDGLASELLGLP